MQRTADKVDSMQQQIGDVSRETEILRRNQNEVLDTKKHCNRNNVFDGLINRLDVNE